MNTFSTAATTKGPASGALRAAIMILANNGFAIVERDDLSADLTGPGLNSTRQNPLLGATKVHLEVRGQQLQVDAELGGVDGMRRFLMRFPFMLGLGLSLVFCLGGGVLLGQQFQVGFGVPWAQGWRWMLVSIGGSMLPVAPWLVLSPLMSNLVLVRTQRALKTLAENAIKMGTDS
jgi:hypothetical protein